jgi:hypothetical protein
MILQSDSALKNYACMPPALALYIRKLACRQEIVQLLSAGAARSQTSLGLESLDRLDALLDHRALLPPA